MKRHIQPAVYMMASGRRATIYTGVSSDLVQRAWQHREHVAEGFTTRYNVGMLVWYELHATMASAIMREKAIKKWRRVWKFQLIEAENGDWRDLWPDVVS